MQLEAYFLPLLLQPGLGSSPSGISQWLVEFLIQPQFQGNPGAAQVASTVFWITVLLAMSAGLLIFVGKIIWEKQVRQHGVKFAALGPRRSRVLLFVGFFAFLLAYFLLMFGVVSRPLVLMGAGNLLKMAAIGVILFVFIYLVCHTVSEDYRRHLPWKKVR